MDLSWIARQRRWFRFSLRTLLVFAILTGPMIGQYGPAAYKFVAETINPPEEDFRNFNFFCGMER